MPVVAMREILDPAFAERYGVAAINVVDDLTLEAVLAAATELEAPLIVQTSLKTVKAIGARAFYTMWRVRADEVPVPVTLHLDHCPDREWISTCLRTGWNSVLFDGSELDVDENTRQTIEVVAEAERLRRAGRGRDRERRRGRGRHRLRGGRRDPPGRGVGGVHRRDRRLLVRPGDRHGPRPLQGQAQAHARAGDRARRAAPDPDGAARRHRASREAQFTDLIARGCAKVNISTALKIAFIDAPPRVPGRQPWQARPALALPARPRRRQGDGRVPHPHLRLGWARIGDDLRGR